MPLQPDLGELLEHLGGSHGPGEVLGPAVLELSHKLPVVDAGYLDSRGRAGPGDERIAGTNDLHISAGHTGVGEGADGLLSLSREGLVDLRQLLLVVLRESGSTAGREKTTATAGATGAGTCRLGVLAQLGKLLARQAHAVGPRQGGSEGLLILETGLLDLRGELVEAASGLGELDVEAETLDLAVDQVVQVLQVAGGDFVVLGVPRTVLKTRSRTRPGRRTVLAVGGATSGDCLAQGLLRRQGIVLGTEVEAVPRVDCEVGGLTLRIPHASTQTEKAVERPDARVEAAHEVAVALAIVGVLAPGSILGLKSGRERKQSVGLSVNAVVVRLTPVLRRQHAHLDVEIVVVVVHPVQEELERLHRSACALLQLRHLCAGLEELESVQGLGCVRDAPT
mmetsp:Transcript_10965/g.24943  ORF Transcript_10965/g.24943 Transcript_10965/m.24943 type:complete len:395 (-) Transcript_10965:8051-9235(-)